MTAKRFELMANDEVIIDNCSIADDGSKQTYWAVEYVQRVKLVELLNELHSQNKRLEEKIQRERRVSAKQHLKWSKEAENKIKELSKENEQLKKELLFFYDVANCECSTNWKEDMEKGCKRFFNCTYEEAKEKYGDYNGMWWEIND